ncbi:serine/threonine-protein phosphatase PGAM5, mitochondrial-like isoform X2 [Mizuhopecten yessoensis]|uniref:serine/threonine-protein phosphatase PGAM5, mitochondrial-like isoform X2 n=1 Tax=Mizuhopecten yessoensis TaxID=6573 RepID=UPI000B45754C|nr:serine/threonine-protein phosphatase PGAM5, mitochondrial-like isoform X2 [Mizuhopecten yessoensis]
MCAQLSRETRRSQNFVFIIISFYDSVIGLYMEPLTSSGSAVLQEVEESTTTTTTWLVGVDWHDEVPFFFGGVAVAVGVIYNESQKHTTKASWTTNVEPSVKWDHNWDRCDPASLVKPSKNKNSSDEKDAKYAENELKKNTPTATRHLLLIRHGQYNTDGEEDNQRYLTELGRKQAEYAGQRLKDLGLSYTVLLSSTMTRAKETADIIQKFFPNLPRKETDMLRTGAPIPPEPPNDHWQPKKQFLQDGARIEAAFKNVFHRADPSQEIDSHEIVVCHGNVIRYFVCRALQFPPEAWIRISLNHASITWITIRPSGRVFIRHLGESGFMPADKVSGD